jgi:hypothetical protein
MPPQPKNDDPDPSTGGGDGGGGGDDPPGGGGSGSGGGGAGGGGGSGGGDTPPAESHDPGGNVPFHKPPAATPPSYRRRTVPPPKFIPPQVVPPPPDTPPPYSPGYIWTGYLPPPVSSFNTWDASVTAVASIDDILPPFYGPKELGGFLVYDKVQTDGTRLCVYWFSYGPIHALNNYRCDALTFAQLGMFQVVDYNVYLGSATTATIDPIFNRYEPALAGYAVPPYIAAMVVRYRQIASDQPMPDPSRLLVHGEGLLVRDPRLGVDANGIPNQPRVYSTTPALFWADFKTSPVHTINGYSVTYGLKNADNTVDWASVASAATLNETDIGGGVRRFVAGIQLAGSSGVENERLIRQHGQLNIVQNNGLDYVWQDAAQSAAAISLADTGSGANLVSVGPLTDEETVCTRVRINFSNSDVSDKDDTCTYPTTALGDVERSYTLGSIPMNQAIRHAQYMYRMELASAKQIPVTMNAEGTLILPGVRLPFTSAAHGVTSLDMLVSRWGTSPDSNHPSLWTGSLQPYDASVYDDTPTTASSSPAVSAYSPHVAPPDVANVAWNGSNLSFIAPQIRSTTLYGTSFFTATNLGSYDGTKVNDGATSVACFTFNTSGAADLKYDSGSGNTTAFRQVTYYISGALVTAPVIEHSDDGSTWTAVTPIYSHSRSLGGGITAYLVDWSAAEGDHRYWRVRKNGTSAQATTFTEVAFATFDGSWPFVGSFRIYDTSSSSRVLYGQPIVGSAPPTVAQPLSLNPIAVYSIPVNIGGASANFAINIAITAVSTGGVENAGIDASTTGTVAGAVPPTPTAPVLTQDGLDVRIDFSPPSPIFALYSRTKIVVQAGSAAPYVLGEAYTGPLFIRGATMNALHTVTAYVISVMALVSSASASASITPTSPVGEWPIIVQSGESGFLGSSFQYPIIQLRKAPTRNRTLYGAAVWSGSGITGFNASNVNDGSSSLSAGTFGVSASLNADFGSAKEIREFNATFASVTTPSLPIVDRVSYSDNGSTYTDFFIDNFMQRQSQASDASTGCVGLWPTVGSHRWWKFRLKVQTGSGTNPIDLREFQVYDYSAAVAASTVSYNVYRISEGSDKPKFIANLPNSGDYVTSPYDISQFGRPDTSPFALSTDFVYALRFRGVNWAAEEGDAFDCLLRYRYDGVSVLGSAPSSLAGSELFLNKTLDTSDGNVLKVTGVTLATGATLAADTDGTFAANSDSNVATQKAAKTYVDGAATRTQTLTNKTLTAPAMTAANVTDGDLELSGQRVQVFQVQLFNNAGTLQARFIAEDTGQAAWGVTKVTGASTTLTNLVTVTSGVDFTNGIGIDTGNTNTLLLNVADQGSVSNLITAPPTISRNTTGATPPTVEPRIYSQNVNGTTRLRFALQLYDALTGAAWTINTTNIPASKVLCINVMTFLK